MILRVILILHDSQVHEYSTVAQHPIPVNVSFKVTRLYLFLAWTESENNRGSP